MPMQQAWSVQQAWDCRMTVIQPVAAGSTSMQHRLWQGRPTGLTASSSRRAPNARLRRQRLRLSSNGRLLLSGTSLRLQNTPQQRAVGGKMHSRC
jgi:hypothetical protein